MKNLPYPASREALADQIIEILNELMSSDREAIGKLIEHRVSCSDILAAHPTIQVQVEPTGPTVGLLGILNGLVGIIEEGPRKGWGFIAAEFDDDGQLVRFQRTPNAE